MNGCVHFIIVDIFSSEYIRSTEPQTHPDNINTFWELMNVIVVDGKSEKKTIESSLQKYRLQTFACPKAILKRKSEIV